MKRYNIQNQEEYNKKYIVKRFRSWDSLERNVRKQILHKLKEDGWLTWNFRGYISDEERSKYINIVKTLITLKKDYLNMPITIPNITGAKKREGQSTVSASIDYLFLQADEFVFYDFITVYINTGLSSTTQRNIFVSDLDKYFKQVGVNRTLTQDMILPRQAPAIQEKIILPTLELLNADDFKQINNELNEGFEFYKTNNYGDFILCCINALVSTLEYITTGKITKKKKKFKVMISKMEKKDIISEEMKNILKNINKYTEITRCEVTKAHLSENKATEQEALFILNLTMSIIQFLILNNK